MLTATEPIFSNEVLKRSILPRTDEDSGLRNWRTGKEDHRVRRDKQALLIEVKDFLKAIHGSPVIPWAKADELVNRMERLGLGR